MAPGGAAPGSDITTGPDDLGGISRAPHPSQWELRELIDSLFSFVGLCDSVGNLVEANTAALTVAGLEPSDVLGVPLWDTYWLAHDPEVQRRMREAVERALAGERSRCDVMARIAGGRLIPIDFQLAPMVVDGQVVAMVPSGLDISERMEAARRLATLSELSSRLNAAVTLDDVQRCIITTVGIEDASFVNVGVIDHASATLRIVSPAIVREVFADAWDTVSLDPGFATPFHDAIRTGRVVMVPSNAARRELYPALGSDAERTGLIATVAVPLHGDDGVVGVIGLGWSGELEPSAELEDRLELLGDLCSQAVQRALRTDAVSGLVTRLQTDLLTAHDHPVGVDIALGYRPAVNDLGIGGDWYDVIQLDDGRIALGVGDVVGHGIDAAARMAQIRTVVRSMTQLEPEIERVFRHTTRSLAHATPDFIATAGLAVLDLANGLLRWTSAGHHPPVVCPPGGPARQVDHRSDLPLGLVDTSTRITEVRLGPDDLLVLYTDGLIERPPTDLFERVDLLLRTVEAVPADASAAEALDHIVGTLLADAPTDDVAIIVARPRPPR